MNITSTTSMSYQSTTTAPDYTIGGYHLGQIALMTGCMAASVSASAGIAGQTADRVEGSCKKLLFRVLQIVGGLTGGVAGSVSGYLYSLSPPNYLTPLEQRFAIGAVISAATSGYPTMALGIKSLWNMRQDRIELSNVDDIQNRLPPGIRNALQRPGDPTLIMVRSLDDSARYVERGVQTDEAKGMLQRMREVCCCTENQLLSKSTVIVNSIQTEETIIN